MFYRRFDDHVTCSLFWRRDLGRDMSIRVTPDRPLAHSTLPTRLHPTDVTGRRNPAAATAEKKLHHVLLVLSQCRLITQALGDS